MYKESIPLKESGAKKKGVAKESDAQEVKNLENDIPVDEVAGATKKKGGAKKKPDANGDGVPDYAQDSIGASRMGFTQNFGAARQNSYSQGAAKVASIMSFGASKKKGAADHQPGHIQPFDEGESYKPENFKSDMSGSSEIQTNNMPKANFAYQTYKSSSISGKDQDYVRQFSAASPLGSHNTNYNSNDMVNYSSGSPANQKSRKGMIEGLNTFMADPTSSASSVESYLKNLQAGDKGELISDIIPRYDGGSKNKKHAKKTKY